MVTDKIIVTVTGIIGIIITYWFFFGKREDKKIAKDTLDVIVKGGYSPSHILLKQNKTTTLNFIRRDPNPCLEEVVIPDFKIRKYLPLNEKVGIKLTPDKKGEHTFSCGMNMYFGRIGVV